MCVREEQLYSGPIRIKYDGAFGRLPKKWAAFRFKGKMLIILTLPSNADF